MTDTFAPARFERPSALAFLGYAAGVVIILWCFAGAGFSVNKMITSPPRFADFIDRAFPPNVQPDVLARLGWKMIETLQIALAGAVLGIIFSIPVALLAARGLIAGPWVNQIVRTTLGFIRAVPDIAWALVFVVLGSAFLAALGIIAAIYAMKFDQMAAITNFIVTPLAFLSGTFYALEAMPRGLQIISHINPVFYLIDGARYGVLGVSDSSPWLGLIVASGATAVALGLCWWLLRIGYRLKN